MPIYEYECTDCGNKFEFLHIHTTTEPEDEILTCAACGGYHILQVPSAPAIAKLATPAYGN